MRKSLLASSMASTLAITSTMAASFAWCLPSEACTDFQLKTSKGAVVIGRSMEWGADLKSRLVVHPRNEKSSSTAPGGKSGLTWQSKFGYVGVDANGLDVSVDGMNEQGLSFGLLWLPDYTKYQDVSPDQTQKALAVTELGAWVLGNFATVDEVKAALSDVRVWASVVPSFGGIPTAHMAVHDAQGHNLVVEFVDGQQKIYDNPIGVMTNSPTFDWHLTNLKNYLMVRADKVEPIKLAGAVLAPFGQGSGFFGIPGDWSPPSRFVRTTAMVATVRQTTTSEECVNLAEHVLNAVDIPAGSIREKVGGVEYTDYTQWIVIKDLASKKLYCRSYDNLTLRALDLTKLDFTPTAKRHLIPIAGGEPVQEIKVQ